MRQRLAVLVSTLVLAGAGATWAAPPYPIQTQRSVETWADAYDEIMAGLTTGPAADVLPRLEALAAAGEPEAMNLLAGVLADPPAGVTADPERAESLWRKAIAAGSDGARLTVGARYLHNDDPSDDAEGVALITAVTTPHAQHLRDYQLGRALLFGLGTERDMVRGTQLLRGAVEAGSGDIDARFLLGRALQNGWGVTPDPGEARVHLTVAAEAGDPRAQWQMGMMLLEGAGGPADPVAARAYVRRSAEAGNIEGQISMAVMLALGQGGPVDQPQARNWYLKAAQTGSAHAMRGLGMMLLVGEGGPPDEILGAALLELAAEGGDDLAVQIKAHFADALARLDRPAVAAARSQWIARHGPPR